MNRRGFLGLFGAGVVAGPSVARNAIHEAYPLQAGMILEALPDLPCESSTGATGAGFFNSLDRMAKLRRLISGEETEQETPWVKAQGKRLRAEHAIHSLGSISSNYKIKMICDASKKIKQEENAENWLLELLKLDQRARSHDDIKGA